jgi:hypothetical protein
MVVPCIVKLFSATDRHVRLFWSDCLPAFLPACAHRANRSNSRRTRATRMSLLQNLDKFASHLTDAVVNESVFPQIALGFSVWPQYTCYTGGKAAMSRTRGGGQH